MRFLAALLLVVGCAATTAQAGLGEPPVLVIPASIVNQMLDAGARSTITGAEEAFCLLGTVRADSAVVDSIYRPQQVAYHVQPGVTVVPTWDGRLRVMWALVETWQVDSKPCPAGTLAGVHTHPTIGAQAGFPSEMDEAHFLMTGLPFHLIVFPAVSKRGPQIAISTWMMREGRPVFYRLKYQS
jgi:hypothetical protein